MTNHKGRKLWSLNHRMQSEGKPGPRFSLKLVVAELGKQGRENKAQADGIIRKELKHFLSPFVVLLRVFFLLWVVGNRKHFYYIICTFHSLHPLNSHHHPVLSECLS